MMRSNFIPGEILLFLAIQLHGCTYTSSVSQTNIPLQRNHPIEASVKKYIILGFNFDNDEVYQLQEKLVKKCPEGKVRGILTQDMRTLYFWVIFWARETIAKGYCITQKSMTEGEITTDPDMASAVIEDTDLPSKN